MPKPKTEILRRARRIKLLLMDVDGVLTDGSVVLAGDAAGRVREIKAFSSLDGAGLRFAKLAGLRTGVITGRQSAAVTARAKELEMDFCVQDAFKKLPAFERILRRARLKPAEVCFVGDDVTDLPVLARCGLGVAVANAHPEAKRRAHYVTRLSGGRGAVREVIDILLLAQGKYAPLIRRFLRG